MNKVQSNLPSTFVLTTEKEIKRIRDTRAMRFAITGALGGLSSGIFIKGNRTEKMTRCAAGALGGAIGGLIGHKITNRPTAKAKQQYLDAVNAFEAQVKQNYANATGSFNNIFSSYADGFMAETFLYENWYDFYAYEKSDVESPDDTDEIKAERLNKLNEMLNKAKKGEEDLAKTIANRKARDLFKDYFIENIKGTLNDCKSLLNYVGSMTEIEYGYRVLKSLRERMAQIEYDYTGYVIELDKFRNLDMSMMHKIKRRSKGESSVSMSYEAAPFRRIFHTYVDYKKIGDTKAFYELQEEIMLGAKEDIDQDKEKGTWLLKRNFSETWLFSLGDFSSADAEELGGYLGIEINVNTNYDDVKKLYKETVKKYHSDVSEDSDDTIVGRISTLMKKYTQYVEAKDRIT